MALAGDSIHINVGGAWKDGTDALVKVGGVWRKASSIWVKTGGAWKEAGGMVTLPVYGAANETVTYSGAASGTVTLDGNGGGYVELTFGTYTFYGGISGFSATVAVDKNTTAIFVRPARIIYWYGVEAVAFGGILGNDWGSSVTRNAHDITFTASRNANGSAYRSFMTANPVSLAGCNSLKAILEGMAANGWYTFGAVTSRTTYEDGVVASNKPNVTTVDISGISDGRYIGAMGTSYAKSGDVTGKMHAVWLE